MSGSLGKYEIIREIARSNDIVYEGFDPTVNRRVAVKELAMPGGQTAEQRQDRLNRFQREARAAGSLGHPNIVTVYDVSEDQGRQYIAMEYLDGRNLRQEIEALGFIPPPRAVEIASEVLQGLAYAHANGIVHRDIKPENIQILSSGRVKITDFGIARITFEPNLTISGQVFGTPSYMAPEQVTGQDVSPQTDLFAVGVLLYEMVSGQKPFTGDSVPAITHQIMNSRPQQPPQAVWGLWQVIDQALEKAPALRHSTAEEFIVALRSCLAADPAPAPSPPPPMYAPAPMPSAPLGGTGGYQPYNPYGSPGPTMGQPAPGSTQLPLYYPPSKIKRPPLLTPEAKQGLGKFVLIVLVVGLIFATGIGLVAVGAGLIGQGNGAAQPAASAPPSAPVSTDSPLPAANSVSVDKMAEAARLVASGAETSFDPDRRADWAEATVLLQEAMQADPAREEEIRAEAVRIFGQAAVDLGERGERLRGLEALSLASAFVPEGRDDLTAAIRDAEQRLGA